MLTDVSLDIANYIYENPTKLDWDLQGIWIADREYLMLIFCVHVLTAPQLPFHGMWYKNKYPQWILFTSMSMYSRSSTSLGTLCALHVC